LEQQLKRLFETKALRLKFAEAFSDDLEGARNLGILSRQLLVIQSLSQIF
jgi:hypothetical protein